MHPWIDACRVPLFLRCRVLRVRVGLDQAGINSHALAADQPFCDAACHGHFEQVAQKFALPKSAMPVLEKGRLIGNAVVQIETAEQAIGQGQRHLFTQTSLGPDAETVPNQKHPDQEFRVNRRMARVAVEVCEMRPDTCQISESIERARKVILGNVIFQQQLLKQRRLCFLLRSRHRQTLHVEPIESAHQLSVREEFFSKISHERLSSRPLTDHYRTCGPKLIWLDRPVEKRKTGFGWGMYWAIRLEVNTQVTLIYVFLQNKWCPQTESHQTRL